jgi:ribose-phosphate pyrophosphokinase
LFDDMIDGGGTMCNAAEALKAAGAGNVSAYAVHGVLSNGAAKRIQGSALDSLIVTDSIKPSADTLAAKKIRIVPTAALIGEAIRRISNEESISKLFD